ncbi:MAG: hypothetical protein ACRCYQ_09235 [Nocardioides sp.]
MTTTREIQRKIRQFDGDIESIYELLAAIQNTQTRHGNRFTEIAEQLEAHDDRFDAIDRRLDAMDKRFDGMDKRFDGMDKRLDGIDGRFDGLSGQMAEALDLLRAR